MEIPYYILLIIYLIGLGAFFIWGFFNMYHIVKFGLFDFAGKIHTFFFIGITISILIVSFLLLKDVPWFDTFEPLGFLTGFGSDLTL